MSNKTKFRWALLFLLPVLFLFSQAQADDDDNPRLALVVGNSAYSYVTPLDNPKNDAVLMAESLEAVGFDVMLVTDASRDELTRAIADFGRKLRDADDDATGLFYYAGHGVQSFGSNFLLPVDVNLSDAADLSLVAVPAQALLRQMFSARNQTNIVILDACRDNPFEAIPDLNENGLAEMKAPRGTFLAYSTGPGEVALDGVGANSPFTSSLARRMSAPGVPIETLFKNVRRDVLEATNGVQTPWDTSSMTANFQFVPAVMPSPAEIQERQLWETVKLSKDPIQVMLFLRANPESRFAGEARSLLQDLVSSEMQETASSSDPEVPAPAPAPVSVDPSDAERALIEAARQAGTADAYKDYLDTYPDGHFSELARLELQTIERNEPRTDPISEPIVPVAPTPEVTAGESSGGLPDVVAFNAPLGAGDPEIATRSISDLISASPRFPPIEGLPEAAWKDKTCASCHQWEQANLCTQAKTYMNDQTRAVTKEHPFGGVFKQLLRIWAEGGCQ
ncbi:caspase family protein [Roseibium sp. MMSF_3412]|uniref:caspase family protein n=1 Tax=Roseibium sp. MMSF_3412 TaxID=3046712 RepID=UPI00273DF4C7|nr:caspase family protein [Roseibium sp. MMSF_3412]